MSQDKDVIAVSTGCPVPPDPKPAPAKDNYHPGPDFDSKEAA